ncbi:MAG: glutamate--tRNA ligase [Acidimicrobiales bacterium]
MDDGPRVRIAPSPTGFFHVGTARTALFNWLFARQHDGTFVLRIEDTDTSRNRAEHVEGILRAMRWLGLDWDEGPYFQSQRGGLYEEAVGKLLASGAAYACDCTTEQVAERARRRGGPPGYDGYCRDRHLELQAGRMVRFRTPDAGQTSFDDVIRGTVTVDNAVIEDFGVRKSSGEPLFILANVVDDAGMGITHVIRGEDHVPNTPKYLLLWEALRYGPRPLFAHLPLLYNDARKKLSKRRDKVAVEDYRDEGYLPEGVRNYLALLGWSPGGDREVITLDEMVTEFRLEDVKSAGAVFDERKLQAVNAAYLRSLPTGEMVERAQAWLLSRWGPIAGLVQERARTLSELYSMTDFLYLPAPVVDAGEWERGLRKQPAFAAVLTAAARRYADVDWDAGSIHDATVAAGEDAGVTQLSKAQAPVRLAVTGRSVGPPLWESLVLLGRDRTLARLAAALERVGSPA